MSSLFNIRKQLTFYGAYHNNSTNIAIHMVFVPILIWTFQVMISYVPAPAFLPDVHHNINKYLEFDLNYGAIMTVSYLAYYFALDPIAALLYTPQFTLSLLSATAYAHSNQSHLKYAAIIHGVSWIAQFAGHGLAEKRAPALLDNLLGAVVLAPFFVHLEILFGLGYRPKLHKEINNDIGAEIARIRKIEGDKKRATEKKEL